MTDSEKRLNHIDEILKTLAERQLQADLRADRAEERMDRAEVRMDRAEERMDRAEERMDRFEQRIQKNDERFEKRMRGLQKLALIGMKQMAALHKSQKVTDQKLQAFIQSLQKGHNGHGR